MHADDIVKIVRDEFGRGNDFCEKITYRTGTARIVNDDGSVVYKNSGIKAEDLLSSYRISYNPRIVVTVDMIATGTDFQQVTTDAKSKDRFVIVDAVGVCEQDLSDTRPLERKPTVSLEKLLKTVSFGNRENGVMSSVASRLARLNRRIGYEERTKLQEIAGDLKK